MSPNPAFVDVPTALAEFRAGRMIIVVDDEDRENEGDLTMAAEFVTPEAINFMARFGRGLICLTLTEERLDYLRLGPMTQHNTSAFGTAFCESIEAREGVTTGISAADRARTIQVAIDPASKPQDLAKPGHVFPLRARKGGVLVRAGQTEASVDLARLAGLVPAGIICEIMRDDGAMARVPDLIDFCREHQLKMITVAEIIRYRRLTERYVFRIGEAMLPTPYGEFRMLAYASEVDGGESHVALVMGDVIGDVMGDVMGDTAGALGNPPSALEPPLEPAVEPVLVRMHTHCLVGGVFGSSDCDCKQTLESSMRIIAQAGRGAIIYLHQTSPAFSVEHLGERSVLSFHRERHLPALPESERRTQRNVGIGAQILSDLNLTRIKLLTNHPRRVAGLEGFGIEIAGHVPLSVKAESVVG